MVFEHIAEEHAGERIVYSTCQCNCGSNSHCVFKFHLKNGVISTVEPDDRYNTGIGREDAVLSEQDLLKNRLQRRPCVKGLTFYKYLYKSDRIIYPLKRATGTKRGEGKYIRISWDEALDIIAAKMKECRGKYGPYSMIVPFGYSPGSIGMVRLFSLWGAGVDSWGWSSFDAIRLMSNVMAGATGWQMAKYLSSSASDMLANSKMIVLWGFDPTKGSCGPAHQFAWFIKLARERGKPVIIIDPRYTLAAARLADQWIPIKPGTDTAMFLAMAYTIFKEGLWNKDFVSKYVEPIGFEKWNSYVVGEDDGIAKTPEWAEEKCAVPAETIRELAKMVAINKPAWLWCHWGVSRKSRGEQTAKAFAALQAMLGYWGTPGAGPPFSPGPKRDIPIQIPWGQPGDYSVPHMYRGHSWADAVLLLDKVKAGELNEQEYMKRVGWRTDPVLLKDFNPHMVIMGNGRKPHDPDFLDTVTDSANNQIKALERMDFIIARHSTLTPTVKYADIILPARDWMFEEKHITVSAYGGFESINYCPGVVEPAGEVKPALWVHLQLAKRLGVDPKKYFKYYTSDENLDKDWERYQQDCYHNIVSYYRKCNVEVPSWEDFTQGKFINCDELDEKPFTGFDEQLKEGKPFKTESGKIEIYSSYIADENNKAMGEHRDPFGRVYENLPGDWGDLTPAVVYKTAVRSMNDPLVKKYPLMLLTPPSRYRIHYVFWNHHWLRNHVYRHRVWINPADARNRGIKDSNLIRIYNDRGSVVLPAYITSRVMPGIAVIHHGAWYQADASDTDFGGAPSTLLGGDFESCTTPAMATTLVQAEIYKL